MEFTYRTELSNRSVSQSFWLTDIEVYLDDVLEEKTQIFKENWKKKVNILSGLRKNCRMDQIKKK